MNTILPLASLLTAPIPGAVKKKRVLLVGTSPAKRQLRAEIMRKLGIDVDCAADISEALSWWRADLYNLVLIDAQGNHLDQRNDFCDVIRRATPPQRLAFLVGKPDYLADAARANGEASPQTSDPVQLEHVRAALAVEGGDQPQRWGILEASRRISAARSKSLARTQAMRALPDLPRDSEGRPAKRTTVPTDKDDLLKEELR
jgi:CheY-like chemotaxis protein